MSRFGFKVGAFGFRVDGDAMGLDFARVARSSSGDEVSRFPYTLDE